MAPFLLIILVLCILGEGRSETMLETICVDMYKQPSLDHPALLNHKIQLKPTFPTETKVSGAPSTTWSPYYSFMNNSTITCPEGMVPIQRQRGNKNVSDIDQIIHLLPQNQYFSSSNIQSNTLAILYRGASAEIRVQNPRTEGDQFSSALVRVVDDYDSNEVIAAGWGVGPGIFGDTKTHLYGSFQIGGKVCVGTINCKGFVQIDRGVYIGLPFPDVVSDPKRQITLEAKIFADQGTGNWWLTVMGQGGEVKIGYWPKEVFGALANVGAQVVEYGGYATSSSSSGLSPPMGTGNKAGLDLYASAYFGHVKYVDVEGKLVDFSDPHPLVQRTNKDCYDLIDWGFINPKLGYIFTYGGPGGRCNF